MPKIVQHRRGTTAQVSGITGAAGELFVDTSKVTVVVMDGILQGGVALATETNLNNLSSNVNTLLNTATTVVIGVVRPDGTSILVTSGVISANISTGSSSIAGILRPDGTSILVTSGVISIATIGVATSAIAGTVQPDGTSIVVTSGVISINSTVTVGAGTVSAPALTTLNDTNTGIYFPEADTMAFTEGGAEVMRINSSGTVSIGTSTTGTHKLLVSGSIADTKGDVRAAPPTTATSAYTLVAADAGKHVNITTGGVTIAAGVFSTGDMVTIFNNSAASQTITQGTSTTVYLAGFATTGNRTLAQRGLATVICVAANTFAIAGSGLT